jgi:polar amino acid transport system substrate-binding protein
MKAFIAALFALLAAPAFAQPLKLVTEDYPPYAFRENGELKGTSVDQVNLMMKATDLEHSVEMMPWARALALAEKQPDYCVFTTAHTAERDANFKWVEPLLAGRTLLIRKAGSDVAPADLDAAKKLPVGATRDDFTADLLKAKGFEKIDLAADFNLTLKKLMLGRIDLMPIAEDYFAKLRREGVGIERVLLLSEQIFSLACNKAVPDADIAKMQDALNALIADGKQKTIFKQYGLEIESH